MSSSGTAVSSVPSNITALDLSAVIESLADHENCSLCHQDIKLGGSLEKHLASVHGKHAVCCIQASSGTRENVMIIEEKETITVAKGTGSGKEDQGKQSNPKDRSHECIQCGKKFSHLSSLRRHGELEHSVPDTLPSFCVDAENGIFMVGQGGPGQLPPIHVQKSTLKGVIRCTDEDCTTVFHNAGKQNPAIECQHLKAVVQSLPIEDSPEVDLSALGTLREKNVISSNSAKECEAMYQKSLQDNVPLVVFADFTSAAFSDRMCYYSVYAGKEKYFSPLSRLRVTLDTEKGLWYCQCPVSGEEKSCLHQAVAKWFVANYQPQLMFALSSPAKDLTKMDKFKMMYYLSEKLIPYDLPDSLLKENTPPTDLTTTEDLCPMCGGNLIPDANKKARIYGMGVVWKDILIKTKKCSDCELVLTFQNYTSGLHNFNDRVVMTLRLCCHIVEGLKVLYTIHGLLKSHMTQLPLG